VGRREDKKAEKRERLEAQALALFDRAGYDRASIEQIAAAADVARGTFYLYFSDKRSVFAALADRWFAPVRGLLEDTARRVQRTHSKEELLAIYQELGLGLVLVGLSFSREIAIAFRELRRSGEAGDELRARERQLLDIGVDFTATAIEKGLLVAPDARLVTYVVYGAAERLYYELLQGTDLGDPQASALEVVRLFARAFGLPQPA
jgi:AcrR family transcriptional regulator